MNEIDKFGILESSWDAFVLKNEYNQLMKDPVKAQILMQAKEIIDNLKMVVHE